jgi:hypothetical protein
LFRLAFCLSLLLHGLILCWPKRAGQAPGAPPLPVLILRLPVPAAPHQAPAAIRSPSPEGGPRAPPARPLASPLASRLPPLPQGAAAPPTPAVPPAPRLDLDAVHMQARDLGRTAAAPVAGGAFRKAPPEAVPDLVDRPLAPALARRLGRSLTMVGEQVLADGSHLIRFSGNRCLVVPRLLPAWRESQMVPTELVPTNCPD